ncbi:hypothetical protein HYV91_01500 [Candidatus Wolfebacteria bacterium]|nr:hypothetical protein [Candidatus Wolfebacteria bacterium]
MATVPKSVILACDFKSLWKLEELARATAGIPGVGAFKVGFRLVLRFGLPLVVQTIREYAPGPEIIYDHQKAGTDIPDLADGFAEDVKYAGADAVILFPFGGLVTQREWIRAAQAKGLKVLVGGHMTQKGFLVSEGGYIADEAPALIYNRAVDLGVTDFVVPGNQPGFVAKYREEIFDRRLREGKYSLNAPGFVSQTGDITETGRVAGPRWNAIVGRALVGLEGVENIKAAAIKLTAQILAA